LRSITFIENKVGFAVGDNNNEDGSLFYSYNGGISWKQYSSKLPDLHRIKHLDTDIWAVGKQGVIVHIKL